MCKVRCPGHVTDSGQTDRCAGAEPGCWVLSWCEQCEENWWRPAAWDWAAAIMELALVTSSQHSVLSHSSRHRAEKLLFQFLHFYQGFLHQEILSHYLTPEHCCHPSLLVEVETLHLQVKVLTKLRESCHNIWRGSPLESSSTKFREF